MIRDALPKLEDRQRTVIGRLLVPVYLSLGLALTLVWTMGGRQTPVAAAEDGTCWARVSDDTTDYTTVQAAVDAAQHGDVVKVAGYCAGAEPRAGVSQTVYISKSITLRGGYTVTDWTTPDPVVYATVLDAEQQGRVLTIVGPPADLGTKLSVTLEGLQITGGDADGLGGGRFGEDVGGGLYANHVNAKVRGNQVSRNTARRGGGLYLNESSVELSENSIICNTAGWDGGGLYVLKGTSALHRNTIVSNTSRNGGGVYVERSDLATFSDNAITTNRTSSNGAGVHIDESKVTLLGNEVTSNIAGKDGGGLSLDMGSAFIVRSTFKGNRAGEYGGGIRVHNSDRVTITDSMVLSNTSLEDGGGLHLDTSVITLRDSLIQNNTADDDGGGAYLFQVQAATIHSTEFVRNAATDKGGAMHLREGDLSVFNSILAANTAYEGSGMYLDNASSHSVHTTIARNGGQSGIRLVGQSAVALTNTILASHTVGVSVIEGSTGTLAATLWGSGAWANQEDWGGGGSLETGSHNYQHDPAFVAPDAGDYHIGPGSGALDRGLGSRIFEDIDGDPRPIGAAPDLGADEIWQLRLPLTLRSARTAESRHGLSAATRRRGAPVVCVRTKFSTRTG